MISLKKEKIPVVIVLTQLPLEYKITEVGSPFGKSVAFFTLKETTLERSGWG